MWLLVGKFELFAVTIGKKDGYWDNDGIGVEVGVGSDDGETKENNTETLFPFVNRLVESSPLKTPLKSLGKIELIKKK